MRKNIRNRFRATERDLEIVAFIGRHRAVEARQIAERFGMHRTNAHRRLGGLVRQGLLEHRRLLHARPGVYLATRAGLDIVGLELPVARLDLRCYEHDVELVWLALELEREFGQEAVVTERELRSRDMSAAWAAHRQGEQLRPRYAVASGSGRAPRGLHFPDLAVEGGAPRGGLLAVEFERTAKGATRRREIVAAYQNGVHVEQVRYYGTAEVLRAVERTVAEQRANRIERVFDLRGPRAAAPLVPAAAIGLVPLPAIASVIHRHHRHHHRHHRHHHELPSTGIPLQHVGEQVMHFASGFLVALLAIGLPLLIVGRLSRMRWTWAAPIGIVASALAALVSPPPYGPVAGALVAAGSCSYGLWDGERQDERRGGRHRRLARAKVGPGQWLSRARARRQVRTWPHGAIELRERRPWRRRDAGIALGETVTGRKPVWLGFDQLAKHLLILGATGGGKSNSLLWVTTRAIRAGYGAIVIDMKADPGLLERVQAEAGLWRRPFYRWRIDGASQLYNPLKRGNSTARRDRLVASQSFSEDYYKGLFSAHAKAVLDALEGAGREPTLAALADWWDVQDLKASVRAIPDEAAREAVSAYCERLPRAQLEHIASLRARIVEVTDTAAGESLRSGSSLAFELDLLDALQRGSIVVLSINADSYPGAAATIGNLVLQDLVGVVGELRQARRKVRSVVAVDEFGALSGEQLGRLLSTGRDVGLSAILAGQDLAQLRRVSEHFEAEVKANISGLIAHRQSEPDSAEQIARICGTEEVVLETHQIDRRRGPRPGGADAAYATGVGSRHLERDFRIGPDQVKELDNGEAAVKLWNPPSADLVRIYRCESTEELGEPARIFEPPGTTEDRTLAGLLRRADLARVQLASPRTDP